MKTDLQRFTAVVKELPTIPAIASKVMGVCEDSRASADDLRAVLEQDPALSSTILKVANSSLYSFTREVETLRHAITLLGFRTVQNLVMATSLRHVFKSFGLTEKLLWQHSTLAGAASARLASYGPIQVDRESAFTAGLLHDLGKIAFSNTARERYNRVLTRIYNEGMPAHVAEKEEFGFDHAELGSCVAEKWRLPRSLQNAIRFHHHDPSEYANLSREDQRLVSLTTIVTLCCTCLGFGRRSPIESIDISQLPAWSALGLTQDDRQPILEQVGEEAKRADGLFG